MNYYGTYRKSVHHYGHIGRDQFLCWRSDSVGFNAKDIKTGSEMGSVRKYGRKFGPCSGAKSVFMRALRPYFVGIRGRRIHYEMVGIFAQVKERDAISGRGERTIEAGLASADGLRVLSSYSYPKAYSLYGVLGCQFRVDWARQHCTFPDLDPAVTAFSEGATI